MRCLGIDTSNYTTSVALTDEDAVLVDVRRPLAVPQGAVGLRQSDALFQHWDSLPDLLGPVLQEHAGTIAGVCVSTAPRPVPGSYMPVFKAGKAAASLIADALRIPLYETSHQEGHLKAAAHDSAIEWAEPIIAAHLSGGTTEILLVDRNIEIVGGTRDLSFGQLIDRIGRLLGCSFPAGPALDQMAHPVHERREAEILSRMHISDGWVNVSGTETQAGQLLDRYSPETIASALFYRMAEGLIAMIERAKETCGARQVLLTGGVAASRTLRAYCREYDYHFGVPSLCTDNAVGVALTKGRKLWD